MKVRHIVLGILLLSCIAFALYTYPWPPTPMASDEEIRMAATGCHVTGAYSFDPYGFDDVAIAVVVPAREPSANVKAECMRRFFRYRSVRVDVSAYDGEAPARAHTY